MRVEGSAIVVSRPRIIKLENSFFCVFQLLHIEEVQKGDRTLYSKTKVWGKCWDSAATAFAKSVKKGDKISFTGVLKNNEHNDVYIRFTSFTRMDVNNLSEVGGNAGVAVEVE